MLAAMIEGWTVWLFLAGVAVGALVTGVILVRLPRREDDVSGAERPAEAAWIGAIIEHNGGIAPVALVDEVLELHQAYLADPRHAQAPLYGEVASPIADGATMTAPGTRSAATIGPPPFGPAAYPPASQAPAGYQVGAIAPPVISPPHPGPGVPTTPGRSGPGSSPR